MCFRLSLVLLIAAASLASLTGCASTPKLSDLWPSNDAANPGAATQGNSETTGSIVTPPAEPGASGEPVAPLAKPGLLGDDPNDDLQRGKRFFRANSFANAERSFRAAVEKHPRDAEAWVGLAASYDRLRRFDLADRAYQEAIRIVGRTPEVLNDQGFSYILRGDYGRAQRTLHEALSKDPGSPYIQANMRLLEESSREGKAIQ